MRINYDKVRCSSGKYSVRTKQNWKCGERDIVDKAKKKRFGGVETGKMHWNEDWQINVKHRESCVEI